MTLSLGLTAFGCGGESPPAAQTATTFVGASNSSSNDPVPSPPVSSSAAPVATGVNGRVTLGPTCPGAQKLGELCVAPMAGVQVLLLDADGATVGTTTTAADGRFEIQALPGLYRVQVAVAGKLPTCPIAPVAVEAGASSTIEVKCDSGMR